MLKFYMVSFVALATQLIFSQNNFSATYSDHLKENANAIIRNNQVEIEIVSFNKMDVKRKRIITVFNETGLEHLDAYEHYDKSTTIKKIEVTVYNAVGAELKKIKRKDFKDHAVTANSIITDNRVLYLEYIPTHYPITFVFESEITSTNTAFIPTWSPWEDYNLGVEKSSLQIKYAPDVSLKYKELHKNDLFVEKIETEHSILFTAQNLKPVKKEELSPSIKNFTPYVMFGLDKFSLEGIVGYANSWEAFGNWMYTYLLKDTEEIPVKTLQELKALIGTETDRLKIAKIVYEFVQNKTRYVSVQLGIGGWKPMYAKDVDRLGYGDCKALTNYTRSLLKAFDVPSYYTVVYGDKNKRDLEADFVSMQGNHVILGIPNDETITWLECTSQTQPFGFQGDFTDDRNVLIIDEDKAKIIRTQAYNNTANTQKTIAQIELLKNGDINCDATIVSNGIIYDSKFYLETTSKDDLIKHYQKSISNINNKTFNSISILHSKAQLELAEKLNFTAKEFVKNSGQSIILPINIINPIGYIPPKYKDRKNPFQISRGYQYEDEISISIPPDLKIESIPTGFAINSVYGEYSSTVTSINKSTITFKRTFLLKEGNYTADQYEDYRKFREQISKYENFKIVLNTH